MSVDRESTRRRRARRGTIVAVVALLAGVPPAAAQSDTACPPQRVFEVPGAERQKIACLADLTTAGTVRTGHTNQSDWDGLHADGTRNPTGVPGIQVDGYFPDTTTTATPNTNNGYNHDAQFVVRFPDRWNGKLVITGAPGIRKQYANDFLIGDYVLAKGYAFASTDKGNSGAAFYQDGTRPGDAVAEWHRRVTELTVAAKAAVSRRYGRAAERTYVTGISNGGYLTRFALENHADLYDGGVDWEGTLLRAEGPNLFTYLPTSLREYPKFESSSGAAKEEARKRMYDAGFEPGSELLWQNHYAVYWDLTQRLYREEFDPDFDGPLQGGPAPFCQSGTPRCDADYDYASRPQAVKDAVASVSNSGRIGKPLLTLHGTLDALLPIRTDSDVYAKLVDRAGRGGMHRYYTIEAGNHVDGLYDDYKDRLRPILPCYRASFDALERWVEGGSAPPGDQTVPRRRGSEDVVNECGLAAAGGTPSRSAAPAAQPGAKPRLAVRVSPKRLRAGRRSRVVFRVTSSGRPLRGALVRFAGRGVRTDRLGRAAFRHRFARAALRRVVVTRRGYVRATKRLRVARRAR